MGARLILVDRSQARLEELFGDAASSESAVLEGDIDLMDPCAVAGVAERAIARFGRMDVLVNTVGAFRGGQPFEESDLNDWVMMFDLNVRTAVHCCRAVVPHMRQAGCGKIINIGSRVALVGEAGLGAYSASKSALLRLTESLAQELKYFGIQVNAVLPGTMDTPQNRLAMPDADHATWVEPSAIADVIVFLGSNASRGMTGALLPVYGRG
jgi:NAD(P)-dependent dehydrogenase (short-subunit alcohol dehydrogenase family)